MSDPLKSETTAMRDEEVMRILLASNECASLMHCRVLPVDWKLRAFGVSEALIQELCK